VTNRGFSAGQAACDGRLVYTCAADGYARAHDAFTGQQVWAAAMVSGDQHRVALYSGWDDAVVLGAGAVIVATVSGSLALEAATGSVRWKLAGSTMYPPAVVLGDGTALLTDEQGTICRVDLADGRARWQAALKLRVLNAGVTADSDTAWVLSARGRLIGVRLADGRRRARCSTPSPTPIPARSSSTAPWSQATRTASCTVSGSPRRTGRCGSWCPLRR